MKINKLSARLLSEGWTREQTPPDCNPWSDFDGGWTYNYRSRLGVVFETPCGLLIQRSKMSHSGTMSYMGRDWTEENDCATIICPHYKSTCELVDPLLGGCYGGGHYESLQFCAVHQTDKVYDYEHSIQRIRDLQDAEMERLWKEFSDRHNGRACRLQSRYNRTTRMWSTRYDPLDCAIMGCSRCVVLQKDLDPQRGNVFCDIRTTRIVPGEGLFPDEKRVVVKKGVKLLPKTTSMTICEMIVKCSKAEIEWNVRMKHHHELFFDQTLCIEVENLRAARRDTRDLMQDLQDTAAGVAVIHSADEENLAKEQKRAKRKASMDAKQRRMEKLVLETPWDEIAPNMRKRICKTLGDSRVRALIRQRQEAQEPTQLTFEEV